MFPGFLVRLFRANPDEFLEDVAHLDVVHAVGREVDGGECFDDEVEQIFLGHLRDLHVEAEALGDGCFDAGDQFSGIGRIGVEKDVAALHVSSHRAEVQRLVERLQIGHTDLLVPADIDAAQEGDVGGHTDSRPFFLATFWRNEICHNDPILRSPYGPCQNIKIVQTILVRKRVAQPARLCYTFFDSSHCLRGDERLRRGRRIWDRKP